MGRCRQCQKSRVLQAAGMPSLGRPRQGWDYWLQPGAGCGLDLPGLGEQEPAGGRVPSAPRCQLAPRVGQAWLALPRGRWQSIRSGLFRSPWNHEGGLSSHGLYQIGRENKPKQKFAFPKPRALGGRGEGIPQTAGASGSLWALPGTATSFSWCHCLRRGGAVLKWRSSLRGFPECRGQGLPPPPPLRWGTRAR